MAVPGGSLRLSGERFVAVYRLTGGEAESRAKADDICIEQTIEFPIDLVPPGDIRDHAVGRVESFDPLGGGVSEAAISFAVETVGTDLAQLLNVLFGNISLKPGIRLERVELSPELLGCFRGPRFGREGLRRLLGAPTRPLLCTAVKPMGLSASEFAELAYQFALGGIDIIKDDHGLADQPFGPFRERVERCVEAVARANRQTAGRSMFVPNVTAPAGAVRERVQTAKSLGAGGLLIAPGLVGPDTLRLIAEDDEIALPILSHPTFQGAFVTSRDSGISPYVLFGQLNRLAGADATIFPNHGGRFAFTIEDCRAIAAGCTVPMGGLRSIFPVPGGGMNLDRIPDMLQTYGRDLIFLIGGGLHRRGPDLAESCRYFRRLAEEM